MHPFYGKSSVAVFACVLGTFSSVSVSAIPCSDYLSFMDRYHEVVSRFAHAKPSISETEIPVTAESLLASHRTGFLFDRTGSWNKMDMRGVFHLDGQVLSSKSTRSAIRKAEANGLRISFNHAAPRVIECCASMERQEGNQKWMTNKIVNGKKELYERGFLYSLELWDPEEELVAGQFGLVSDGHVEGVSKFRNLNHSFANNSGHVLDAAKFLYFWNQGIQIFDAEVVSIPGAPHAKQHIKGMPAHDFDLFLERAHSEHPVLFKGARKGEPLPAFDSNLYRLLREYSKKAEN